MAAVAPDGGCRAWLVVFARFVLSLIVMGSFKALGVFVPVLQESLGFSAGVVGLSFGLSGALNFLLGPVTAAMLRLINYRVMVMLGGAMSATGLILAGQVKTAGQLAFTMILLGMGNCVIAIPAVVALSDYFDKKFAFVNGLSTAGGAIGMMALSPLAEFLIERYGWRGAFLVVGAIGYNMVVAGALMRPLLNRNHRDKYGPPENEMNKSKEHEDMNDVCDNMQSKSEDSVHAEKGIQYENVKDIKYDDIGLPTAGFEMDLHDQRMSSTEISVEEVAETSSVKSASKLQLCCKTLTTSLGFKLFYKQKHLVVYLTGFFLWGVVYSGWTIFLVSFALSKDIESSKAALLSSFGGLGTLIGRLAHGPFIDRRIMTGAEMFSLLSLTCSVTMFLYAFVSAFAGLGVLSAIVGMCIGTRFVLAVVVMKENVEEASFKEAAGWSYFFQGLGTAIGSPLTGLIYDLTSSFQLAFFAMAGLEATIGVLFLAVPKIKRYLTKKEENIEI